MNLLFLVFLLVSASAAYHHDEKKNLIGNALDDLVKIALESLRKYLQNKEPFSVPEIVDDQIINDDNLQLDLTAHLSDYKVSKTSTFQAKNVHTNLFKLSASASIALSDANVAGKISIQGTKGGKPVSGQGDFSFDITNILANMNAQMELKDHSMDMKDIQLNYSFSGIQFHQNGIVIDGVSEANLEDLFNKKLAEYFQKHEKELAQKLSDRYKDICNSVMKGKTLQQLIDWLKNFINQ